MKRASVEAVARALTAANVPFIIVGGLAVVAHGYNRFTHDLDLVIRIEPVSIRGAFDALASLDYHPRVPVTAAGMSDPDQRAHWVREKNMTVLNFTSERHRDTPVDIFVEEPFDFSVEYSRAYIEDVAFGIPVRILNRDTLIRLKQQSGRPQDLADISALRQGEDTN